MKIFYILSFLVISTGSLCAQSYKEVVEKAMEYTQKDSLLQAEELFRKALKMDPKNPRNALLFPIWEQCRNGWEKPTRPSNLIRWL